MPIGQKIIIKEVSDMAYWGSRGLRGSSLEELVNLTNERYREHQLALIEKIPTPIKPIQLDSQNGTIKLAYFDKKGSVDYIGVVQGIAICFDAKETGRDHFPLKNIHEHQITYMDDFMKQRGIAFLIVSFTHYDKTFFLPFDILKDYWDKAKKGGRKSIPYKEFLEKYEIKAKSGYLLHYLAVLNVYLSEQEE